MNDKQHKNRQRGGTHKPQYLNTGLADGLSVDLFQPLPSALQQAEAANPETGKALDHRNSRFRNRRTAAESRPSIRASNINTGLADAFGNLEVAMPADLTPSVDRPRISQAPATPEKRPQLTPRPDRPQHRLPSHMLKPLSHLPEWENTRNFVFVNFKGRQYTYPVHSWLSVMDLCETIYRDCANSQIIREQSRKAIVSVVESYCNRGHFNLIPRSHIERSVRKHLGERFKERLSEAMRNSHPTPPAGDVAPSRQGPAQTVYEERMRAYRVRNPRDAEESREPVRNRLYEYIAAKAKRVGDQPRLNLAGAFTQKAEDARTVWIGLDYGTQNVKVAFRDGETDNQSVILELNPSAHGIRRFMLSPVTLVEGERLIHRIADERKCPSWKHALSYYYGDSFADDDAEIRSWLDICAGQTGMFANRSTEDMVLFFTSVHIAFLLGTAGRSIREYYRERGITDNLGFRVFMCAPVAALDQQLSQSIFQDCLTIADEMHAILDFSKNEVSVRAAFDAYDQASRLGILLDPKPSRRSRIVPEVLAEIASFTQSRSAREGVYALVDIGAGTLDLNVFKVLRPTVDEGVRTPVYAATCHPNGVKHLETLLYEALGDDQSAAGRFIEDQKMKRRFPDVNALAASGGHAQDSDVFRRLGLAHNAYCDDVAKRTRLTWGQAWEKRGLERQPWTQLTMFLCGGGAAIQDIQSRLEAGMPDQIIDKISHRVLPCPSVEEFVRPTGFPEEDFHRVAVAYGLTFGSDFEPYIMLPSEVPKVRVYRDTFDVEPRYISKDMV